MSSSHESLKALQELSADPSKLTGVQLTKAMHEARKIQIVSEHESEDWKAAAKLIDILTVENTRRLFPNEPPPKSGAYVPGRRSRKS